MAQKIRLKQSIVPQLVETQKYTSGFYDKLQEDEIPAGSATADSFNFILDKDGKWTTRLGSKYLGTKSPDTGGCTSSAKILRRDGVEAPLVFYTTKSKYIHPDTSDWRILENTYTTGLTFGKAMGEKSTDNVNYLIFGNGTDNYRYWNGITGTVLSFTANTVVLTGATTLADRGFRNTGSDQLSDNGTIYTYTGLSGSTFTGVTPDPTISGMVVGDALAQAPVNSGSLPLGNVMTSYNGRIVMFTKPAAAVYGGGSIVGSKLNVYDDFSFTNPGRIPAEGYQIVMSEGGGNGVALVQYEGGIACFKQNAASFHQVTFDQNDFPVLKPLLPYDETLSGHVGCVGPKAAFALRNQVFFVSPRKVINTLQRVSQVDYPQALPFSDRIQDTVDNMTWGTDTATIGFNYYGLFCGRTNSTDVSPNKQLVYDQRFDAWWTPLIGQSLSSYFVYGGDLYGTLADSPDVIKLFTGYTDFATSTTNGNPINAKLVLEKQNFEKKSLQKKSHRLYVEGWMSKAGTATFTLRFSNLGGTSFSGTLRGTEDGYFFDFNSNGTFGVEGFGVDTFGGTWMSSGELPDGIGHFRILLNYPPTSFWNIQFTTETSSYYKLLAHGFDSQISDVGFPSSLKKALA